MGLTEAERARVAEITQDVIDSAQERRVAYLSNLSTMEWLLSIIGRLSEQPEVVRCGECVHRKLCCRTPNTKEGNGFCDFGQRAGEEEHG